MLLELSEGELLDRRSILELKQRRIIDQEKLREVEKEIQLYDAIRPLMDRYRIEYGALVYVNGKIWELNDQIVQRTELDHQYAVWTHAIFDYNMQRFRIKNQINQMVNSTTKEQKSYSKQKQYIAIEENDSMDQATLFSHVLHTLLEYDEVICYSSIYNPLLRTMFPTLTFTDKPMMECNSIRWINHDTPVISELRELFQDSV